MSVLEHPVADPLALLRPIEPSFGDGATAPESLLGWLTDAVAQDHHYHDVTATLTASENHPSEVVRAAAAFFSGAHYYFDAPTGGVDGEWAFPHSAMLPALAQRFVEQMRQLFAADIADWRPNGGATCEQAVMLAACRTGEAFLELAPQDGGHFGTVGLARRLGVDAHAYPMRGDLIDVEATAELVRRQPRIRLALVQPSHCRRVQPIAELADALPDDVTIAVDVSHTAGLIAGGVLPQPLLQGADIMTFNTHKTVPGPNKAVIAFADRHHPLAESVWSAVCPGLQSNSHPECLPGLVIALEELTMFGHEYAEQTVSNARALERALTRGGVCVAGVDHGPTETHQVHVVIGPADASNQLANEILPRCGLRTNSVMIPGTGGEYGLRLGTQALTRRGLTEPDFAELGDLLARTIHREVDAATACAQVAALLGRHPLFPLRFSFDGPAHRRRVIRLLAELR